ncbi:hypothetical protein [Methanofollis sp.]|uniref:type II toxin-antitoxin system HicB family antitoxin n=1 Tax=Methanofollis sp. TaxID=2052835 RepID=UPI0034574EC3
MKKVLCPPRGVRATGATREECRENLGEVIDDWLVIRLRREMSIPPIEGVTIEETTRMDAGVGS